MTIRRIGIDLLGSDTEPSTIYQGVVDSLRGVYGSFHFYFYGTKEFIDTLPSHPLFSYKIVSDAIEMSENPLTAVRRKKDSSLARGVGDLRDEKIDALISCGNTGAIIALATLKLDLLAGVVRPALMATLPTSKGYTFVVDVGGSALTNHDHLIQFTKLGVEHLKKTKGIERPKVALLNIGTESLKGTPEHQRLYHYLKSHQEGFDFLGNTEGKQVFSGDFDLIVTDGFTGNVFLKTAEGAAHFLINELQHQLSPEENSRLLRQFEKFSERFSQNFYPGAFVLGLKQLLVKCHGKTNKETISQAVLETVKMVRP